MKFTLVVILNEDTDYGYFKEFENKNELIDAYNEVYNDYHFNRMKSHTKYPNGDETIEVVFNRKEK